MQPAAFVLAGGRSSRMGRDKALLPLGGRPLVEHIAAQASTVTGNITLVGHPDRYANLGYPVIQDIFRGCGPLAGIHAALRHTRSPWNLVLACDMPQITAEFLRQLVAHAEASPAACVIPVTPDKVPQPLCAAYRSQCADAIGRALETGVRKVIDALATLPVDFWSVASAHHFRNLNTPQEWDAYSNAPR